MRKIIYVLTIFLSSCSMFQDFNYSVEPILTPFVNSFYVDAEKRNIRISNVPNVIFSDEVHPGGFYKRANVVKLNPEHIKDHLSRKTKADSNMVKLEVYHELGHSIGKAHRGSLCGFSIKCDGLSIMNAGDISEGNGDFIATVQYFNAHPEDQLLIIDELFSK